MSSEKEILSKLEAAEKEIKSTRSKINNLRSELWECESDLLTAQLEKEKLLGELKQFREDNFDPADVARDEDIERFSKLLPDLMKKVE